MIYYNADGSQSMCGNGARCAVAFSSFLGIVTEEAHFLAIDGPHDARIEDGNIALGMGDVTAIERVDDDFYVNTGSPHHVRFVKDVENYPVVDTGASIRYSDHYTPKGTNVNFVSTLAEDHIYVRTYERGVEDETLSCGTGVTACALIYGDQKGIDHIKIKALGGNLAVKFKALPDGRFTNILLIGPAQQVFKGTITV